MNIRFIFVVSVISVALLGAGCRPSPRSSVVPPPSSTDASVTEERIETMSPMAILVLRDGSAAVTRGDHTEIGRDGLVLLPGDTVEAQSGTVELMYPEAGASYLPVGSKVTLLPDREGDGSVFTQIELEAGSIWTRFERLLGSDERFSVSGNNVVATVRGTAFGMMLMPDGSADVRVGEHQVDVRARDATSASLSSGAVRVGEGQALGLHADVLRKRHMKMEQLQSTVRSLDQKEKQRIEFQFLMRKLPKEVMERPTKMIRMNRLPVIPERYRALIVL